MPWFICSVINIILKTLAFLIISVSRIIKGTQRARGRSIDRTMVQPGRRYHQSASIGGRDPWLVPKGEGSEAYPPREQVKPSQLLRFDHPDMRVYPEYKYTNLPPDKKRIRLMKFYPGEPSGTKIYCELIEVEYDRQFHIPTRLMNSNADQKDSESSHDSSSSRYEPDIRSGEDNRSYLETRNEEKTETREKWRAREKGQAKCVVQ